MYQMEAVLNEKKTSDLYTDSKVSGHSLCPPAPGPALRGKFVVIESYSQRSERPGVNGRGTETVFLLRHLEVIQDCLR